MNSDLRDIKRVSVRELQHNLSGLLEVAKSKPMLITKHGREEALLVNPKDFMISRLKPKTGKRLDKLMKSSFIGMHKYKKEWKSKTSLQIAEELRKRAWHGI